MAIAANDQHKLVHLLDNLISTLGRIKQFAEVRYRPIAATHSE